MPFTSNLFFYHQFETDSLPAVIAEPDSRFDGCSVFLRWQFDQPALKIKLVLFLKN
jgi:hypothetical protein